MIKVWKTSFIGLKGWNSWLLLFHHKECDQRTACLLREYVRSRLASGVQRGELRPFEDNQHQLGKCKRWFHENLERLVLNLSTALLRLVNTVGHCRISWCVPYQSECKLWLFFYNWNVSIGGNLRNLSFAGWIRMVERESNLWSWINVQIFFLGSFTMFLAWTSIYFWTRMRRGDVWHRLKCAASKKFMLNWCWFVNKNPLRMESLPDGYFPISYRLILEEFRMRRKIPSWQQMEQTNFFSYSKHAWVEH